MSGPIDIGTAAILGAVQGATEFLPVSSDGHIALFAMLFGVADEMPLSMVVLLHVGTLIATIILFHRDLTALAKTLGGLARPREWIATDDGKLLSGIVVASVPTALIGLLLESRVEEYARVPWIVGAGLLGSAFFVFSTRRGGGGADVLSLDKAFVVGLVQGLAVMPGLSRSGITIAVGMMLGLSGPAAFRFSFLLSMPAIAGASILMLHDPAEVAALGSGAIAGGLVAFVVGCLALFWLRSLVQRGRFWTFALYLVPLGIGLIAWQLSGRR